MVGAYRRVVITGLGAVTPLGPDAETSWSRLLAGDGACRAITAFPAEEHPVRIACEAEGFEPGRWLDKRALHRTDRFAQLAVAAARMGK